MTPRTVSAEIDLRTELGEVREALRPFVVGQVSTLPEGVLVLVSPGDLEKARRVYMNGPPEDRDGDGTDQASTV